eukprot:3639216-Prymnesium_polylepis.1
MHNLAMCSRLGLTEDGRREKTGDGPGRQRTGADGSGRERTEDGRRKTGRKTEDGRRKTGDGRRETGRTGKTETAHKARSSSG